MTLSKEKRAKDWIDKFIRVLEELDRLNLLNSLDIEEVYELVEKVWLIVYKIGKIKDILFTKDQKRKIGSLIESTLHFLPLEISYQTFILNGELLKLTLRKRSGIQFFLDRFKDFPTKSEENLKDKFEDFERQEEIEELTDELRNWAEDKTYFVDKIPDGIPESHTWWQLFFSPNERNIPETDLFTETVVKITCVITDKKLTDPEFSQNECGLNVKSAHLEDKPIINLMQYITSNPERTK